MTKIAVIQTGGKQYKVSEGDTLKIEKLKEEHKVGAKITFNEVLLVDDGKDTKIGTPHVSGAKVEAVLEEEGRDKKVTIIKFKSKSNYSKKLGHRQPFAKVKITAIK
ncbi:50S ribosomal protein L21 [Patescibacteria group bacterium]